MTVISRVLPLLGLLCAAAFHPAVTANAEPVEPSTWPVADGTFTSPGDPGWVFFKPQGRFW